MKTGLYGDAERGLPVIAGHDNRAARGDPLLQFEEATFATQLKHVVSVRVRRGFGTLTSGRQGRGGRLFWRSERRGRGLTRRGLFVAYALMERSILTRTADSFHANVCTQRRLLASGAAPASDSRHLSKNPSSPR